MWAQQLMCHECHYHSNIHPVNNDSEKPTKPHIPLWEVTNLIVEQRGGHFIHYATEDHFTTSLSPHQAKSDLTLEPWHHFRLLSLLQNNKSQCSCISKQAITWSCIISRAYLMQLHTTSHAGGSADQIIISHAMCTCRLPKQANKSRLYQHKLLSTGEHQHTSFEMA